MKTWHGVTAGLLFLATHTPSYAQSSLDIRVAGDARAAKKILELQLQQQPTIDPKKDFDMFLKCGGEVYSIGYDKPEDFVVENGICYRKPYKGSKVGSGWGAGN